MLMKFATSCGLLVALTATTVLAQPHPKKKPVRKPVVVRNTTSEEGWTTDKWERDNLITHYCTLPLEMPTDSQVEADANPVYTYVEQMPLLSGQPLFPASVAALTHALVIPADAPEGRVFVQFVVTKEGKLSQLQIAKGLRADVDSAVVAAARKLPAFTPGKHGGWAVPVRIMLPISIVGQ
jgi:TonB family protein